LFVCLAFFVCLGVACGGSSFEIGNEPFEIEVSRAVPVADVTEMDVYRPSGGTDHPLLVLLHGTGPGGRAEMAPIARAIAERGVVVFVPDWKAIQERPEWPMADAEVYRVQAEAVVCTLRHARRAAEDFGGSSDRLGLMGHSGGALAGLRVALVDEPPWPGMTCDDDVDHRPDVFIGTGGDYAGRYQFVGVAGDLYDPFDPEQLMGGNPDLVVRLIHGYRDTNVDAVASAEMHEQLGEAGYDVEYTTLDTAHGALIRPDELVGQFVVDRVVGLLEAGGGRDEQRPGAELAFDGTTCEYSGPDTLAPAEPLLILLRNTSDGPASFLFYAIEGVGLDVALADSGELSPESPTPSYVLTGSYRAVPATAERTITWAFVDRPYQWVLACLVQMRVYPTAGLAPTNLG
jgi:predicted esterase